MSNSVFIIAEAGVNHNGNRDLAFQLVDIALEAGADAVKFQTFKAENLVTKSAVKADYQKKTTNTDESQFSMLKRLELSHDTHQELIKYCNKKGIKFLSTAFDFDSLDFLVNNLSLNTLKIPSGEITNGPLLLAHAQTRCNLIISTGMATLGEIEEALGVIAFGLICGMDLHERPSRNVFQQAYNSSDGQRFLKEKVTLLHCTTEYPAPLIDINLKAMQTMRSAFDLKVGYSDHSEGIAVPVAAIALGATLIEKHFTVDKTFPGPDHQASLEPSELIEMVVAIRSVEQAMGDGLKGPRPSELKNRSIARKSLVARTEIKKGDLFSEKNLTIKRPGIGVSPMDYWRMLSMEAQNDYNADEVVE
jgi:N-acetylneuraminate synthase